MLQYLTYTVDPISSVAGSTSADKTPLCVSAVCILMTVVVIVIITLIDVCTVEGR